jgi:hypothetical protein
MKRDFVVLLLIGVVASAVILVLFLASRNAPSAGSDHPEALAVPSITADAACTNFATYWLKESGVDLDAGVIEGLTNCYQAADGSWFLPTEPADERLPADFTLTPAESAETDPLRQQILAQIDQLQQAIPQSIQSDIDNIYDGGYKAISGHVKETTTISRPRGRYTRVAQSFLLAPEHAELAGYVGWMMANKISAFETLRDRCVTDPSTEYLLIVCRGLEDSLSVWYPPWIWDLRDPVSLEAYLAHVVRADETG